MDMSAGRDVARAACRITDATEHPPARAVPYRLRAGRVALDRSAMAEAVAQLGGGLEAVAQLPYGVERRCQEAELNASPWARPWLPPKARVPLRPDRLMAAQWSCV